MLVNVRHADQTEMLNSGKRFVKNIAEDSGDVTSVLSVAKFASCRGRHYLCPQCRAVVLDAGRVGMHA